MAGARNGTPKVEKEFPDNLTTTERRFYDLFCDGERHKKWDLLKLLDDELAGVGTVRKHICTLREKLPPERIIVCEVSSMVVYYRMVCPLFPNWISPRDQAAHDSKSK